MKPVQRKCGTCKWLRPRSDGKPFHHGHSYACQWRLPASVVFPACVRGWTFDNAIKRLQSGEELGYMEPSGGKDCPCWEPRT